MLVCPVLAHSRVALLRVVYALCRHQACPGRGVGPTEPEVSRAAVYVTMSPIEKATPQVLEERRLCVELNTGNGHTAHHPMSVRGRNWPPEDQEPPETPYPIERLSEAQRLLVDGGGK